MMLPANDAVSVGPVDELQEGKCKTVKVGEVTVAVFKHQGQVFALNDTCPHRGAPLSLGKLQEGTVICPLHRWVFDLTTGARRGYANHSTTVFPVSVHDGVIFVMPRQSEAVKTSSLG